ncbi:alcohol dehydrogenase Bli-4 [Fusarium tjaetaba]|uniref:Alcohol dehydrogenase Bli-4 n=1 Tax=Fusarium tjaetaba TaxID=1567544 RepID=A0A8H5RID0_9HYPO|nr:alcohol dehydrogenase Bli-4 [Fusarium tjaetaba]KAF5632496.1 alcohol dehydrogenase Bli-4 [Fusarium tjaetaba]
MFEGSTSINFSPDADIPALTGKVILVTGGSNGLGKESILQLAKHEPTEIWMGALSIKFLLMDLGSPASISEAANNFRKQLSRLDILMLNAGIMITPAGLTDDGYEIQFGTNYMGHALLTQLLLPTLLNTAAWPNSDVCVVVLSSEAYNMAPDKGILWDILRTEANDITTRARYGQSKVANILYARELSKRYPQIKAVSVHPGLVKTNLGHESASKSLLLRTAFTVARAVMGVDVATGVLNQLWAATGKGVKGGEYYEPVGVTGRGSKWTKDKERRISCGNGLRMRLTVIKPRTDTAPGGRRLTFQHKDIQRGPAESAPEAASA